MTIGLLLTALGLGLRHGIDWDHIAAIADLSSTAESRRKGIFLSTLYALGHGVVVLALGVLAIVFGAALPEGVDVWMGRIVGITLIVLGAWVLIELMRKGKNFRLRSRWILVLGGTFSGLRRVREARARRRLSIEHDHEHEHYGPHTSSKALEIGPEHDHDHIDLREAPQVPAPEPVAESLQRVGGDGGSGAGGGHRHWKIFGGEGGRDGSGSGHSHSHSHSHKHELTLAESAAGTGNGTAAGIGVLHGIGFESPTQIAVFVASTSLVGVWAGVSLLIAWVAGLIIANTFLAILAAYGLLGAERNFTIYAAVAVFVAIASLLMGAFLLFGTDPPLPDI